MRGLLAVDVWGWDELWHTVGHAYLPVGVVDDSVVVSTEENRVVECGDATVGPVLDVMRLRPLRHLGQPGNAHPRSRWIRARCDESGMTRDLRPMSRTSPDAPSTVGIHACVAGHAAHVGDGEVADAVQQRVAEFGLPPRSSRRSRWRAGRTARPAERPPLTVRPLADEWPADHPHFLALVRASESSSSTVHWSYACQLSADDFPKITATAAEAATIPPETEFRRGLDILLCGLEFRSQRRIVS